ncbi:peptide chain release factor 1, partial [Vibrio splendidus]
LEDPRMSAEFDKLVAAGFLPSSEPVDPQAEEGTTEEKTAPKKRVSKVK